MKYPDHFTSKWHWRALLLLPVSLLFYLLSTVRRWCYQAGLCRSYKAGVPVVVVGNISVGGTGKTPLVVWLVKYFRSLGYQPGVVSRGYGGDTVDYPYAVSNDSPATAAGDEPLLIAQRASCPVVVDPDRVSAVEYLLAHHQCNIVISDDGLQHWRMSRDIEIVVIDGERRLGNGYVLPAGPLRESARRLRDYDMIVVNCDSDEFRMADNECRYIMKPGPVTSLSGESPATTLEQFRGRKVHAVAGIGNPSRFFNLLQRNGIDVCEHEFPDHYRYRPEDFEFEESLPVLMTEKDAVKCRDLDLDNAWYLGIDIQPDSCFITGLNNLAVARLPARTTARTSTDKPQTGKL